MIVVPPYIRRSPTFLKVGLKMVNAKGVAHVGVICLIVVILGVSAVGVYFGYSLSGHSATQTNKLTLESFSLNPSTSNLTGNVSVDSNSPLVRMALYMNGTLVGSFNYSNHTGMMSTMMGSYPYSYSMMYSAYPYTMPMMARIPMMQERVYMVTMMAVFEDGSTCNSTAFIHT